MSTYEESIKNFHFFFDKKKQKKINKFIGKMSVEKIYKTQPTACWVLVENLKCLYYNKEIDERSRKKKLQKSTTEIKTSHI